MRRAYQKSAPKSDPDSATHVQLTLDRGEVLRQLQDGLHAFGIMLGLELARLFMTEEVDRLCGPRYAHRTGREATRHGSQKGVNTIGGQKVPIHAARAPAPQGRRPAPPAASRS